MALDWSATNALLRERYKTFPDVVKAGYQDNPFYAMIPKDFSAGGDQEKVVVNVAPGQTGSYSFTQAQTNAAAMSSSDYAFEVTATEDYAVARVTGRMLAAMRNNDAAIVRASQWALDGAFSACFQDCERALFRDGSGLLGVGDSAYTAAGLTATLLHAEDSHLFQLGMEVGATPDGATNPRVGSGTITGINRETGVLTTDSNWNPQITGLLNSDTFFRAGDYAAANDLNKIRGLDAWCPATVPAGAFFGVARTADAQLLGGSRYDATTNNEPINEALINAQSVAGAVGAVPTICFLNPVRMRELLAMLEGKKNYEYICARADKDDPNAELVAKISFKSLILQGDKEDIAVMGHPLCQYNIGWMWSPRATRLIGYGKYPDIINDDGNDSLRVADANQVEWRVGGYPMMIVSPPSSICRVILA